MKKLPILFIMILSTVSYSQVANTPVDLILCDVDNDGFSDFDLESQTAEVLGAQDPTQFNVSYHDSLADAEANTNTLISPYTSSTQTAQTIFVRVTDLTTNNYTITSFNIIVNELPIANIVSDIEVCDDVTDGDDTNGFVQNFDLESQTAEVLGAQDPTQFNVSYHDSQADAEANTNTLSSPYANSTHTVQTIFVRITNTETGCFTTNDFSLIVNNCSTALTPITDVNFQTAISTCLSTNPVDGLCSDSEYGAMPDWDVSNVTDMSYAFTQIVNFNGDISDWDVSNVTNMFWMFSITNAFNQDIGSWNVSNVTNMEVMFYQASSFNQNISNWCVTNIASEPTQFSDNSPLSESNKPVWGTCPTASVDDQNQLDISIYPNPTSDIVYIDGNYTQLKVIIYNVLGKEILNKSITNSIDISHLDNGVYILQLSDGVKLTTQIIIKN